MNKVRVKVLKMETQGTQRKANGREKSVEQTYRKGDVEREENRVELESTSKR